MREDLKDATAPGGGGAPTVLEVGAGMEGPGAGAPGAAAAPLGGAAAGGAAAPWALLVLAGAVLAAGLGLRAAGVRRLRPRCGLGLAVRGVKGAPAFGFPGQGGSLGCEAFLAGAGGASFEVLLAVGLAEPSPGGDGRKLRFVLRLYAAGVTANFLEWPEAAQSPPGPAAPGRGRNSGGADGPMVRKRIVGAAEKVLGVARPVAEAGLKAFWRVCVRAFWATAAVLIQLSGMVWAPPLVDVAVHSDGAFRGDLTASASISVPRMGVRSMLQLDVAIPTVSVTIPACPACPGGGAVTLLAEGMTIEARWNPAAQAVSLSADASTLACVGARAASSTQGDPSLDGTPAVASAKAFHSSLRRGGVASFKMTNETSGTASSVDVKLRLPPEGVVFSMCALGMLTQPGRPASTGGSVGGEKGGKSGRTAVSAMNSCGYDDAAAPGDEARFFRGNFLFPTSLVTLVNLRRPTTLYSFGIKGSFDASPGSAAMSLALSLSRGVSAGRQGRSPVAEEDVEVGLRTTITKEKRLQGTVQVGKVALSLTPEDLSWAWAALEDFSPTGEGVQVDCGQSSGSRKNKGAAERHEDLLQRASGADPPRIRAGRPWTPQAGQLLPQAGSLVCLRDEIQGGLFLAFHARTGKSVAVPHPCAPAAESFFRVHHNRLSNRRRLKLGGGTPGAPTLMLEHVPLQRKRDAAVPGQAQYLARSMTSPMDVELRPDRNQNLAELNWRACVAVGSRPGSAAEVRCCDGDSPLRLGRDDVFHLDPNEEIRGCELVIMDEAFVASASWEPAVAIPNPVHLTATIFSGSDATSGAASGDPLVQVALNLVGCTAAVDLDSKSYEIIGELGLDVGVLPVRNSTHKARRNLVDSAREGIPELHSVLHCRVGSLAWADQSQSGLNIRVGRELVCRLCPEQLEAFAHVASRAGFVGRAGPATSVGSCHGVPAAPRKGFLFSLWLSSVSVDIGTSLQNLNPTYQSSARPALAIQAAQIKASYASSVAGGVAAIFSVGPTTMDTGLEEAECKVLLRAARMDRGARMLSLEYGSVAEPSGVQSIYLDCELQPLQLHACNSVWIVIGSLAAPLEAFTASRDAGRRSGAGHEALHIALLRVGALQFDISCTQSIGVLDATQDSFGHWLMPLEVLDAVWTACEGSAGQVRISSGSFVLRDSMATLSELSVAVTTYLSKQALYSVAKAAALREVESEPLRRGIVRAASAFMDAANQNQESFYPNDLSELMERAPEDCPAEQAAAQRARKASSKGRSAKRRVGPLTPLKTVWRGSRRGAVWATRALFTDLRHHVATAGWGLVFSTASELCDAALSGAEMNGFAGAADAFSAALAHIILDIPDKSSGIVGEKLLVVSNAIGHSGVGCAEIEMSGPVSRNDAAYVEAYIQALLDTHSALMSSHYDGVRVMVNLSADRQTLLLSNLPALKAANDELLDLVNLTLVAAGLLSPSGPIMGDACKKALVAEAGGGALAARMRGISASSKKSPRHMILMLGKSLLEKVIVITAVIHARKRLPLHNWAARFLYRLDDAAALAIGSGEAVPLEKASNKRSLFFIRRGALSVVLGVVSRHVCGFIPPGVSRRVVSACILSAVTGRPHRHRSS